MNPFVLINEIDTKEEEKIYICKFFEFLYRAPFDKKTHAHQRLINRSNIQKNKIEDDDDEFS